MNVNYEKISQDCDFFIELYIDNFLLNYEQAEKNSDLWGKEQRPRTIPYTLEGLYSRGFQREKLIQENILFNCSWFLMWLYEASGKDKINAKLLIDRILDKIEIMMGPDKFLQFSPKLKKRTESYMQIIKYISSPDPSWFANTLVNLFLGFAYVDSPCFSMDDLSSKNVPNVGIAICSGMSIQYNGTCISFRKPIIDFLKSVDSIKLDDDDDEVAEPNCEIRKLYYDTGELKEENTCKDNKEHGVCKGYYKNGNLQTEQVFRNGLAHGLCKFFREDGSLHSELSVKKGKQDGLSKWYHNNGKLKSACEYRDDKGEGLYREYHKNGKLYAMGQYYKDKENGVWFYYDENGEISNMGRYENGKWSPLGFKDFVKGVGRTFFRKIR